MVRAKQPQDKSSYTCRGNRLTQICVILFYLGLPYTAFSQETPEEIQPTDEVIELLLAGDWDAVRKALSNPIDATNLRTTFDPPNPVATFILGHALMNSNHNHLSLPIFGSIRDSVQWFAWANWTNMFLKQHPDHPIALYLYADGLYRVGDYEAEEIALNKAIRHSKPMSYLYHYRGQFHTFMGNPDLAMADLDSALVLDSNFAEAYYHRGLLFEKMNKIKLAVQEFRKAVQKNDKDFKAYLNLSSNLLKSDEYLEAVNVANQAFELLPTYSLLHLTVGQAYIGLGEPEKAIESFVAFIESDSPDATPFVLSFVKGKIDSLRQVIKN